ncbi:MAG: hypothetical protein ACJ768_16810 [Gaiellaceae bacterium]
MNRLIRRISATLAAALLMSLCWATASEATNLTYWSGFTNPGQVEGGPRHTIYEDFGQTYAGNQYVVGVFAYNTDGTPAGSEVFGNGTVSHSYCACALRYPYVQNAEPYTGMTIVGIESY